MAAQIENEMKTDERILQILADIDRTLKDEKTPKAIVSHLNHAQMHLRTAHHLLTIEPNPNRQARAKNRWTE